MTGFVWFLVLVGFIALISYAVAGVRHFDFRIKVGRGGAFQLKGTVPGFDKSSIGALVADLRLPPASRIFGRSEEGRWRVQVEGVDQGTAQRVRNVLFLKLPR